MEFSLLFLIECIGVVSFAISGTIVAIHNRLDIVGAIIFSLVTCFGGGLMRDIVLGITPPSLLTTQECFILAIICIVISVVLFHLSFLKNFASKLIQNAHSLWIEITDSIGLAAFCTIGVNAAIEASPDFATNIPLLLFCGCITGVGGGVLRDMMSAQIPLLFRKHIYFIPALLGSILYVILTEHSTSLIAYLLSMSLVLIIRILAITLRWNLPTPLKSQKKNNEEKN